MKEPAPLCAMCGLKPAIALPQLDTLVGTSDRPIFCTVRCAATYGIKAATFELDNGELCWCPKCQAWIPMDYCVDHDTTG